MHPFLLILRNFVNQAMGTSVKVWANLYYFFSSYVLVIEFCDLKIKQKELSLYDKYFMKEIIAIISIS